MNQEKQSVREKIIIATVQCIEKYGIHSLTTRVIAKEAGVNSAAINYYFGTKEKLLNETLHHAMNNALGDSGEIMARNEDPYFTLYIVLSFFLAGMVRYPGLMKAFFYEPFLQENYTGFFIDRLSLMLNDLQKKLAPFPAEQDNTGLKLSITQICSAIIFMGLFPGVFRDFLGFEVSTPEKQQEYIEHLFDHYQLGANFKNSEEQKQKAKEMVEFYLGNR